MKNIFGHLRNTCSVAILGSLLVYASAVSAETIISVQQISYDANLRKSCVTQRMNPSAYASLPADACTLGAAGAYGNDRITKTVYDAAGQVTQVMQAYGTSDQRTYSTFSYSLNGKIIDSIDSNGNRTRFSYDGFDRLSSVNYPSTVRASAFNGSSQASALSTANSHSSTDYETFSYDANNNRTSWRRRNGFVINYQYDNLNREFFKDVPVSPGNSNGTDKDVITYYNALGLPSYRYYGSGKYIYTGYDGLGRKNVQLDLNGNYQWFYYNQAGALWVHYYNSSSYIAYYRDTANRPYGVVNNLGQNVYSVTYDNNGRLSNINKGGGNIETYSYDGVGRVTSIANNLSGTVGDVSYTFTYNPASQILSQTSNNTNYDYNEPSNSTQNRAFNGLNQDTGYTYDGNGNLTNNSGRTLTYDIENRLIAVSGPTNATFEYDPNGTLAKQVINGVETRFLYNDSELIGELDSNNNILRRYVHGIGVDKPIAWYEGGDYSNKRYFVQNYQGSVIGYTDGNGTLLDTYKYTAFGEPKNISNSESWAGARFRYTGQIALPEAKLYHYKARVYDPALGTFLQTDPIGTKDDMNMYAYVGGDPVNKTDPTGMEWYKNADGTYTWRSWEVLRILVPGQVAYDRAVNNIAQKQWGNAAGNAALMLGEQVGSVLTFGSSNAASGATRAAPLSRHFVIGRTEDLTARGTLRAGEETLLPRLTPNLGNPRQNWLRNAGELRRAMRFGNPIRDASPLNDAGVFLNAERALLQSRGWTYNSTTHYWNPPVK